MSHYCEVIQTHDAGLPRKQLYVASVTGAYNVSLLYHIPLVMQNND